MIGILTDIGKSKVIEASGNLGFTIIPSSFSVSRIKSDPDIENTRTLTAANGDTWFSGPVSARQVITPDRIRISFQIPPAAAAVPEPVSEVYVFAKDINNVDFLLAVGHTTDSELYSPSGTTTLRLEFKIVNTNITELFSFEFSAAADIAVHNIDPNAHPDLRINHEKAGIYEQLAQHKFTGQHWDEIIDLDAAVQEDDLVYKALDGKYYQAVADGSLKEKVAGIAKVALDQVDVNGIVAKAHGFPENTLLYLHPVNLGQVTDVPSGVPVGIARDEFSIILRVSHHHQVSEYVNAVVSDLPGFNHFPNAQDAIYSVPNGGWVRFDKKYELVGASPLNTNGNVVNFLFGGSETGVVKFTGLNEIQIIDFSDVPDAGDFLLIHDGNKTSRLLFSDVAATVESALEALPSITDVTVTGDTNVGFTIEFVGVDGLQDRIQVLPGTDLGFNEIQLLDFDTDTFTDGSFKLNFDGQLSNAIAFNSIDASTIQTELLALSNTTGLTVTLVGAPPAGTTQFIIEFVGVDGLQPQVNITAPGGDNSLNTSSVTITISENQAGELPDNLLTESTNPIVVSSTVSQEGDIPGGDTAFQIEQPGSQFIGLGTIAGLVTGFDLNSQTDTRIEMLFSSIPNPIDFSSVTENDFNSDGSIGLSTSLTEDLSFRNLVKVTANNIPDFSVNVSSASVTLSDGSSHGLTVGRVVSDFSGGDINFSTGVVNGGLDFIPYTALTASNYYKYAVILRVDNTLFLIPPVGEASTPSAAPEPSIVGGVLRAIVTVRDDGGGSIEVLNHADIIHFFESGLFPSDVRSVSIAVPGGGQSVFDISGITDLVWNPDNSILDLHVTVNGQFQIQGDDYNKTSSSEITFTYTVDAGASVDIQYKQSETEDVLSSTINQTGFRVGIILTDGVNSEFDFLAQGFNWSADNEIYDIEVKMNGNDLLQDKTGSHQEGFIKTSPTKIQLSDTGGIPLVLDSGTQIVVKSREFAIGTAQVGSQLVTKDEGNPLATEVNSYDFVGVPIEATQTSPGQHQIEVLSNEGANIGAGVPVFAPRTGLDLNARSLVGLSGIQVLQVGNEIHFSLAATPYARTCLDGQTSTIIPTGTLYDFGFNKLSAYRLGARLVKSVSVGQPIDRFSLDTNSSIEVGVPPVASDVFCFINEDVQPTYQVIKSDATELGNTVISVPTYAVGTGRLKIWRNGLLLNSSSKGTTVDQYSETSATSITLALAIGSGDFIFIEYGGEAPAAREDIDGVVGNTLTVSTAYSDASKVLLYKNGLLLHTQSIGGADARYTATTPTTFTLDQNANLLDHFSYIVKP